MDCKDPILLPIGNSGGFITVPCRKCYACQNRARGEWAYRAKVELSWRKYVFFLTLTYDNENLKKYCFNVRYSMIQKKYLDYEYNDMTGEVGDKLHDVNPDHYVNYVMSRKVLDRAWDYSLLRKDHLQQFLHDFNEAYRQFFCMYYPSVSQSIDYYVYGKKIKTSELFKLPYIPYGLKTKPGKLHTNYYIKPEFEGRSMCKYYATGEYGDTTHRPHY